MSVGARIREAVLRQLDASTATLRILDAACGDGELSLALHSRGHDVWGIDVRNTLSPAGADVLGHRFHLGDLNRGIPFPDRSFDVVICVEGIEHLENVFLFAAEAFRVCRPGGLVLVTTPNVCSIRSRMRYFGSGFYTQDPRPLDERRRDPLHHINLRTFWEWRYVFHVSGFDLTRLAHTHVKPVSWLYGVFAPWIALYTAIAFRKGCACRRRLNAAVARALLSRAVLFGENIVMSYSRPAGAQNRDGPGAMARLNDCRRAN